MATVYTLRVLSPAWKKATLWTLLASLIYLGLLVMNNDFELPFAISPGASSLLLSGLMGSAGLAIFTQLYRQQIKVELRTTGLFQDGEQLFSWNEVEALHVDPLANSRNNTRTLRVKIGHKTWRIQAEDDADFQALVADLRQKRSRC